MPDLNSFVPGHVVGAGRFELIRVLGRGGMGQVWLARDQRLENQVALKFLPSEVRADGPTLEHLRLEASRSIRLTHPNIARLYDFHMPPGEPAFIAMEYVDGASLEAIRMGQENRVLSWNYLRKPLAQLCAALDYAHSENVVHRDLKPDNLLMDNRGRLKLTDFGLATMTTDLVRFGTRKGGGTLPYMSPQQLEGKLPQVTDDIYALGVTLYDLLTGQPPFGEGDIREQILHADPEPLRQKLAILGIENEVPSEMAAMVMSCLAKDPAQRPPSARIMAEWLELKDTGARPFDAHIAEKPSQNATEDVSAGPRGRRILWKAGVATIAVVLAAVWIFKMRGAHQPNSPATNPSRPASVPVASSTHILPDRNRWTNSLGMVFIPVPECEPLFCIWKTRVQDYQAMVDATGRVWEKPAFPLGPTHPAVNLQWEDAKAFCDWLTQRERASGMIGSNQFYRLPSDTEWSLAVGLGHEEGNTPKEKDGRVSGVYPWGTEWPPPRGAGNFDPKVNVDDFPFTSPVGSFASNSYGLFDMAGNAREWCEDFYTPGSQRRVVRGSSWFDTPAVTLQSSRRALTPVERHDNEYDYFGFRCVLVIAAVKASVAADPVAATTVTAPSNETPSALSPSSQFPNTLTEQEVAAGWQLLFDGRTTAGWRGYKMAGFPVRGWHIADGCLVNPKSNGRPNGSGGDLITVRKFLNFEFCFEWRMSVGGNSGVQYFFDENRGETPVPMYSGDTGNSPMGFEYQILDDPNYPRELQNGPAHLTAALYLLVAPTNKVLRPAGEFNEGRIIVNGNHVEHWLNGRRVMECELGSPALFQAISQTKFKWITGLGTKFATRIALQDHGDEVAFRNLKIRELRPGVRN
ncbi:MAG: protein kinase domain-containing protein [Limisphaerales bacterium]